MNMSNSYHNRIAIPHLVDDLGAAEEVAVASTATTIHMAVSTLLYLSLSLSLYTYVYVYIYIYIYISHHSIISRRPCRRR